MKIEALNAALIDLAQYGRVLVKHPWEAQAIRDAAPEATRSEIVGGMWAVEVVSRRREEPGEQGDPCQDLR